MKTGIPRLDRILKGGFPDDAILLFYGPPGIGKTALGLHYLSQGAKEGVGFYAYYGRRSDEIEAEFKEYGMRLGKLKNRMFFLDTSNISRGSNVINCSLDNLFTVELALKQFIEKNKRKKIRGFIDLLSPSLMVNEPVVIYKFFWNIVQTLKENHCSAVFVLQDGMHDVDTVTSIGQLCDGVLEFKYSEQNLKIKRLLFIRKMRGKPMSPKYYEFQITNRGVKL